MSRVYVGGLIGFMVGCLFVIFVDAGMAALAWSVAFGGLCGWFSGPTSFCRWADDRSRRESESVVKDLIKDLRAIALKGEHPKPSTSSFPRLKWPPKFSDN